MPASLDEVDTLIAKFGLLERDLRLTTGDDETARAHRAGRRHRALPHVQRHPRAAGARAGRRALAGGRRRGAVGGRLDALPALADRQPDGRAPQHRRQHAPVSDPAARAVAPHQAPRAADLEHGTGSADGPAHAGARRAARARAGGRAAVARAGRSAATRSRASSRACRSASGCPRPTSPRGARPTRSSTPPRWPSSTPTPATRPSRSSPGSARSPAATTSPRCTRSSTTRRPTRSSTPPVPSLRWRHVVAAVQAAAISHGRIQDVYEHAADVMQFA